VPLYEVQGHHITRRPEDSDTECGCLALLSVALHCTGRRVTHSVSVAGLLPALEKHGKTCHVLLGPEEVCLLQTTGDADGMQIFISLGLVRGLQAWSLVHFAPS